MPKNFSAYKGTARCCLATTKIRAGESLREVLKILCYGFHSRVCSRCNITTVSGQKKAIGADWSGLERTSEPKRFTLLYIAAGLIIRATARIANKYRFRRIPESLTEYLRKGTKGRQTE